VHAQRSATSLGSPTWCSIYSNCSEPTRVVLHYDNTWPAHVRAQKERWWLSRMTTRNQQGMTCMHWDISMDGNQRLSGLEQTIVFPSFIRHTSFWRSISIWCRGTTQERNADEGEISNGPTLQMLPWYHLSKFKFTGAYKYQQKKYLGSHKMCVYNPQNFQNQIQKYVEKNERTKRYVNSAICTFVFLWHYSYFCLFLTLFMLDMSFCFLRV
jgi:hypothetical protein